MMMLDQTPWTVWVRLQIELRVWGCEADFAFLGRADAAESRVAVFAPKLNGEGDTPEAPEA